MMASIALAVYAMAPAYGALFWLRAALPAD